LLTLHPAEAGAGPYCPFQADGARACMSGQQCCEAPVGSFSTCPSTGAACPVDGSTSWQCDDPIQCGGGACCATTSFQVNADAGCTDYTSADPTTFQTQCRPSCQAGEWPICQSDSECQASQKCTPFKFKGVIAGFCN
jgi:hypothetical protein